MRTINNDTITKDDMIAIQQETIEILKKNQELCLEALAEADVIIEQYKEICENQKKIIDALKERLSMYESIEEELIVEEDDDITQESSEDINDLADRFSRVSWEVDVNRLSKVCDILDMNNPLEGKGDMFISEVPMNLLYQLIKLSEAISAKDAYEKEHSDYYGMWDNDVLFLTVGADINTLIFRIDKEIRDANEK